MRSTAVAKTDDVRPPMTTAVAFLPYMVLTVLALATSLIVPVREALASFSFGLPFPEITTGFGLATEATDAYSPLAPMSHPGFGVLIAGIITWAIFRSRGYFTTWERRSPLPQKGFFSGLAHAAVPASLPVVAVLVMAAIMSHSGQNEVLALGIAAVAPTYVYAFMANGIGILGAFTTASSTSSMVMFSDMQANMAELKGLPTATILAAQAAGSGIGNAIAPGALVMGTSTAGINGKEGEVMRKALPWTLATFIATGAATVIMVLIGG